MIEELAVVSVLVAAVALISCLSVADRRTIRRMPRALWVVVIVLVPLAGPTGWFLAGRPRSLRLPRTGGWIMGDSGRPAPDDDPEFLRSLRHPRDDDREPREGEHRPDPGADGAPAGQ